MKNFLCFWGLCNVVFGVSTVRAEYGVDRYIPPRPTIVSLVLYHPAENYTSRYGHVDLRFSYGEKLDYEKDIVVGFGPPVDPNGQLGVSDYLAITKKLSLMSWIAPFSMSSENAALERMTRVTSYPLDLTAAERDELRKNVWEVVKNGYPKPYHVIFRNCASVLGALIEASTRLRDGFLSFVPEKLAKRIARYSLGSVTQPSGRDLKEELLKKFSSEWVRVEPNESKRNLLKTQLMSRYVEARTQAFRKLQANGASTVLIRALMATESAARQKVLRQKITDRSFKVREHAYTLASSERFKKLEVKGSRLELTVQVPNLAAYSSRHVGPTTVEKTRTWKLSDFGFSEGAKVKVGSYLERKSRGGGLLLFWLSKNLALDVE